MNDLNKRMNKAFNEWRAKWILCNVCFGVGCEPQHFGAGNPDSQPCYNCKGNGSIERQLSFPF